jgi:hypothetical protein
VSEPIKQIVNTNGYPYENITGYRPNNLAKLTSVFYRVQLTSQKARNKSEDIFKALKEKFEKLNYRIDTVNSNPNMMRLLDDMGEVTGLVIKNDTQLSFGLRLI